jgi:SIR2-like domain/Domain of unknown function (DUF4020)
MWIGEVDFPREVLDAQRDGNLVIFAGAGVSKGDPANCPTFWELAEKIGNSPVPDKEGNALDRYLGRLHKEGVRVHEQACRILGESSEPNLLHKELLKLFSSADKVRIVTTNFDRHFSTAAETIFPEINTFYAPALPLGNDFEGIVYLHGSINQRPDRLVLTDSDFGKAYLTEGWATNFLKTLFSHYTVLFVGYSHEDIVVSYLARGLPPNNSSQRFALVRDKDAKEREQNWAHLGIDICTYPTMSEPDAHSALGNSIKRWADRAKMGFLDREEKICRIVEMSPPIDLEEASFIEQALEDPSDVKFFVRHAKSLDWLNWVNNRNLLKPIFEIGPPLEGISHQLAWWFIGNYAFEYPQQVLSIIYHNGQYLNQETWRALYSRLWTSRTQSSDPIQSDPQLFAQWIALLLKTPQPLRQGAMLAGLLGTCRYPEDKQTALLLFNHLTQPELILYEKFRHSTEENSAIPSIDFKIISDQTNEYRLNEYWQNYFFPHLGEFARDLLPLLTYRLQQYYQLLVSVGKATSEYDPLSFGLPIVEIHEPDDNHNIHHLLTNAARQIYDYLALNHPDQSTVLIESWYTSRTPILKRLAVYGVSVNTQMTVNQKIKWLLKRDLLYNSQFKDEIHSVLKKAYPTASASIRHCLLKKVEKGPPLEEQEVQDKCWHYKIYDLLIWLNRVSPDCTLIAQKLEIARQENPEFEPRSYDEFHRQPVFARIPSSNPVLTTEQLLETQPEDFLPLWQAHNPELQLGEIGFEISHYPVSEAVVVSPDWGIQLASALNEQSDWASLLWKDLISGWQQATLNESQWQRVLTLLINHGEITKITRQIADLLDNSLEKITGALPLDMEDIAQQLSVQVWNRCDESEETPSGDIDDYYFKAINDPAGKITLFWLRLIARQRERLGQEWTGLPVEIAECLDKVCLGSSWAAQLSRVILVSQLLFLFGSDEAWTRSKVLPLLSWTEDILQARRSWHGFLYRPYWNDELFPHLLPLFEQTFPHTEDIGNGALRSQFSKVLASIALFETDETMNPIRQGWLKRFVEIVHSQDRRNWAFHIANHLKKLSAEAVVEAWNRWMREYWERRVMGLPCPLYADEYAEMLKWLAHLEPVIQEVLPLIEDGPKPQKMASFWYDFLYHFLDAQRRTENREAWSQLILYLLKHSTSTEFSNFCCNKMDSLITYLKQEPKTIETLRQVCDELGRLGCSNAGELRQSLNLP